MGSSNQTAWRKANLACKLAIDNMEKDELLHGGEDQKTRQRLVQFSPEHLAFKWVHLLRNLPNGPQAFSSKNKMLNNYYSFILIHLPLCSVCVSQEGNKRRSRGNKQQIYRVSDVHQQDDVSAGDANRRHH